MKKVFYSLIFSFVFSHSAFAAQLEVETDGISFQLIPGVSNDLIKPKKLEPSRSDAKLKLTIPTHVDTPTPRSEGGGAYLPPQFTQEPPPFKNPFNAIVRDLTLEQKSKLQGRSGVELVDFLKEPLGLVGLLPGDIIISIDDVNIIDRAQFNNLTNNLEKKRSITLVAIRGDQTISVFAAPNPAPNIKEKTRAPKDQFDKPLIDITSLILPRGQYEGKVQSATESLLTARSRAKSESNTCPPGLKRRNADDVKEFLRLHDSIQRKLAASLEGYTNRTIDKYEAIDRLNRYIDDSNGINSWGKGRVTEGACGSPRETELIGKSANTTYLLIQDYKRVVQ